MSTKIYDAYKFDKNYSMLQLNSLMSELRNKVTREAKERFMNMVIKDFVYYLDVRQFHGIEICKERASMEVKTKSDKYLKRIWQILSEKELKGFNLLMNVEWYIQEKISEFPNNPNIIDSDYDFRSELVIFPIRGKILAMYFGNYELKRIVGSQEYLSDYHYQNQTDRPEAISKKEWNQRMRDWDRALGWDAPSERGMLVELLNTRNLSLVLHIKECFGENKQFELKIPDDKTRISKVVDTFEDYPNPPEATAGYNEWYEYLKTDEFKTWREKKKELVHSELKPYALDMICELLSANK